MKRIVRFASFALLTMTTAAQTPVALPASKGSIEGTVLRNGNNQPLSDVRLTLTRINAANGSPVTLACCGVVMSNASPGTPTSLPRISFSAPLPPGTSAPPDLLPIPSVSTDSQGRFVFPEVVAGAYRISIANNGHVRQEYGQRVFPGQGALLTLSAGQIVRDLVVHLTPTGNVSGRIYDNLGQIAANVPVQLLTRISHKLVGRAFLSRKRDGESSRCRTWKIFEEKRAAAAGFGDIFGRRQPM